MDRTAAVLDILNSNFQQTSIETTLETLQARKSGVICDAMLPKVFTSPVIHRSLKIALGHTGGTGGLWGWLYYMERSQLFEPRYSLSTCQFVIVFFQCLP